MPEIEEIEPPPPVAPEPEPDAPKKKDFNNYYSKWDKARFVCLALLAPNGHSAPCAASLCVNGAPHMVCRGAGCGVRRGGRRGRGRS